MTVRPHSSLNSAAESRQVDTTDMPKYNISSPPVFCRPKKKMFHNVNHILLYHMI